MISYSLAGDSMHVLSLLNIGVYGTLLYTYGRDPDAKLFDEHWLQAGFCLQHDDVAYRTTHDLSGYIMVVIAVFGLALQHFLSRQSAAAAATVSSNQHCTDLFKADNLTFWALIGALGHAFGHFLIANAIRMDFYPPARTTFLDDLLKSSSVLEAVGKACPGYPFFWMPLVSTYMMNTAKGRVALIAFACWIGSMFMQVRFGFSYTQSVLFAGLSVDQLMLPKGDKGFEYALWPLITTLPNGIFAWVESLKCSSSPLMQQHGHLVYDVYMATSYIVFYLICWARANYNVKVKSKTL